MNMFFCPALLVLLLLGSPIANAERSAEAIIHIAREQYAVPSETAWGEMRIYRGQRLHRSYAFIVGKLWNGESQTESIRIDFKTPADEGLHTDRRYLLRRTSQKPATQWLYLPALRRVRIVPYQPDDPLLQSDQLFYDLTTIQNFADYQYTFLDSDTAFPVIQAMPLSQVVPYTKVVFSLEQRGETYLVTEIAYTVGKAKKHATLSEFIQLTPGQYRPQKMLIQSHEGRTEMLFQQWVLRSQEAHVFTPTSLETVMLEMPGRERGE